MGSVPQPYGDPAIPTACHTGKSVCVCVCTSVHPHPHGASLLSIYAPAGFPAFTINVCTATSHIYSLETWGTQLLFYIE